LPQSFAWQRDIWVLIVWYAQIFRAIIFQRNLCYHAIQKPIRPQNLEIFHGKNWEERSQTICRLRQPRLPYNLKYWWHGLPAGAARIGETPVLLVQLVEYHSFDRPLI